MYICTYVCMWIQYILVLTEKKDKDTLEIKGFLHPSSNEPDVMSEDSDDGEGYLYPKESSNKTSLRSLRLIPTRMKAIKNMFCDTHEVRI